MLQHSLQHVPMKTPMLAKYIFPRGTRGILQLRVPIPRGLHASIGRQEFTKSLGTTDRHEAERLALPIIQQLHVDWASLSAPSVPSKLSIAAHNDPSQNGQSRLEPTEGQMLIAANFAAYDVLTASLQARRNAMKGKSPEDWANYRSYRLGSLERSQHRMATSDFSFWEPVADQLILKNKWSLHRSGDAYTFFVQSIAETFMDAMRASEAIDLDEPTPEPRSKAVQIARSTAPSGCTMMELYDRYAVQRRREGKREDTIDQDRKVVALFAEFVGCARDVGSITPIEVREFRDAISDYPKSSGKRNALSGLGVRAAVAEGRRMGLPTISAVTASKYMSIVSPFFRWLVRDLHASSNPFDGLHNNVVRGANPRPPFTNAHLNKILTSPLFMGFERDGREHVSGTAQAQDWRRWIPLVCIFTGARISEVAQLSIGDVCEHHGHWFFEFKEDAATGKRTKSKKCRHVAVHPRLIELGFLELVQRQLGVQDPVEPLFGKIAPGSRGDAGALPSRFWRNYLQKIGIKAARDGLGAHSFRHRLTDELRSAGYLDEQIGPLVLGHAGSATRTTRGYGVIPQGTAKMLFEMVAAAKFDGVTFDQLTQGQK